MRGGCGYELVSYFSSIIPLTCLSYITKSPSHILSILKPYLSLVRPSFEVLEVHSAEAMALGQNKAGRSWRRSDKRQPPGSCRQEKRKKKKEKKSEQEGRMRRVATTTQERRSQPLKTRKEWRVYAPALHKKKTSTHTHNNTDTKAKVNSTSATRDAGHSFCVCLSFRLFFPTRDQAGGVAHCQEKQRKKKKSVLEALQTLLLSNFFDELEHFFLFDLICQQQQ